MAQQLASSYRVVHYDRRGRGESGDTRPYAVEREVEDLAALIDEVGATAFLSGMSSDTTLIGDASSGDPAALRRWGSVQVPTLIVNGSASFPFMALGADALAKTLPHAEHGTLEGQSHEVESGVIAPLIAEFFAR
jgi:pimeloyl-ACP methyl ester carboxylesterase